MTNQVYKLRKNPTYGIRTLNSLYLNHTHLWILYIGVGNKTPVSPRKLMGIITPMGPMVSDLD